jgi:hypothetical protein
LPLSGRCDPFAQQTAPLCDSGHVTEVTVTP